MDDSTLDGAAATSSIIPKACENCRVRKIRCNKVVPCSNCETSGIECKPATKHVEPRSRVSLSANYERAIESINDRLSGIEDTLRGLQLSKANAFPISPLDGIISHSISHSDKAPSQHDTPAAFEGASSFTTQAIQASQAAGRSLSTIRGSAQLKNALASLSDIGQTKRRGHHGLPQSMRLGGNPVFKNAPEMQLLPSQFVLDLLRVFRNRPACIFLAFGIRSIRFLDKLCQQAYFPTEPMSVGALTVMHGLIYYLIYDVHLESIEGLCPQYDLEAMSRQAEHNFHLGIETYEVMAVPSLDNARALMLAMLKSQDECKSLLTWTFTSCGARQVISLGYHREATLRNDDFDEAEEKRQVFWAFYMVDKNLSLNLGYTSTFQDYDIDVKYFSISLDPGIAPWDRAALAVIDIGKIQGIIYEKLYSLKAMNSPSETRKQIIQELEPMLEAWHQSFKLNVSADQAYLPDMFFMVYGPFDVVYYSVLSTMHRAASPSYSSAEITSACYEAGKKSLQAHLHFVPLFASYSDEEVFSSYVTWTLLYCTYTPLIVVFLHALASASQEDVNLLHGVEESIRKVKDLNPQFSQLYGLSKTFYMVAQSFVETKSTFIGTYNSSSDTVIVPKSDHTMLNMNQYPVLDMAPVTVDSFSTNASFDETETNDMSQLLGNWLGQNAPVSQIWTMDFMSDSTMR